MTKEQHKIYHYLRNNNFDKVLDLVKFGMITVEHLMLAFKNKSIFNKLLYYTSSDILKNAITNKKMKDYIIKALLIEYQQYVSVDVFTTKEIYKYITCKKMVFYLIYEKEENKYMNNDRFDINMISIVFSYLENNDDYNINTKYYQEYLVLTKSIKFGDNLDKIDIGGLLLKFKDSYEHLKFIINHKIDLNKYVDVNFIDHTNLELIELLLRNGYHPNNKVNSHFIRTFFEKIINICHINKITPEIFILLIEKGGEITDLIIEFICYRSKLELFIICEKYKPNIYEVYKDFIFRGIFYGIYNKRFFITDEFDKFFRYIVTKYNEILEITNRYDYRILDLFDDSLNLDDSSRKHKKQCKKIKRILQFIKEINY